MIYNQWFYSVKNLYEIGYYPANFDVSLSKIVQIVPSIDNLRRLDGLLQEFRMHNDLKLLSPIGKTLLLTAIFAYFNSCSANKAWSMKHGSCLLSFSMIALNSAERTGQRPLLDRLNTSFAGSSHRYVNRFYYADGEDSLFSLTMNIY